MSNVVRLFKDEEPEPSALSEVMDAYVSWARKEGADTDSPKFLYGCTTIMTLMQIGAQ